MSQHNENTATLNTLIATLIDSVEGYEKSAGEVQNPRFAEMFRARAGAVMSGRRPAIKGDIWFGEGHGCGHVFGL